MIQWKVYTHCQLLSQANLMPSWMRSDEQLIALNTWFSVLRFFLSPHSPQSGIPSYFPLTFSLQNLLWIVPSCFFQSLSRVRLFATPWTAASQASLSFSNSQSLLKIMSIKLVMPLSHLVLCHQFLLQPSNFPSIRSFPMSWFFTSCGQSIGASSAASVPPMDIQNWFPLGLTDLISLQSKGLSRVFFNTTIQRHQFFGTQPLYGLTLTSTCDYWKNHGFG